MHTIYFYTLSTVLLLFVSDMQHVKSFTKSEFFNPTFYPKVCELCKIINSDKIK